MNTSLNAQRRSRELTQAADATVDVLVVGLGVTGAGIALDAASRGLSVVAIDAHDMAFGTSRWSSKLVHGGLRYLANLELDLAYESAVERSILMTKTAPHLIHPMPMVLPLTPRMSKKAQFLSQVGLTVGDILRVAARTPKNILPKPGRISAEDAKLLTPALNIDGVSGAMTSWDGQLEDDARLVIALARTAAGHGAKILTYVRANSIFGTHAEVRDEVTGETTTIRARVVINATGVWASELVPGIRLRPSRGTHIVVRSERLGNPQASLTVPEVGEKNRYVFALPQSEGLTYIGLTDVGVDMPVPDIPEASSEEIDFILKTINPYLTDPITGDDIVGTFAGLRPLLESEGRTADISRKHAVITSPDGVITVIGGKLTTYRKMAQDAVDAAVTHAHLDAKSCRTKNLPLVGAGSTALLRTQGVPERFIRRYGREAFIVASDKTAIEPISDTIYYTKAEFIFGVEHEGALTADDLLERRTRIGLVPADRAIAEPIAKAAMA